MDTKSCIPIQLKREIGLFSHSSAKNNDLCKLAEDKAAERDSDETSCSLPGNPRSTFLMVFSPDGTKIASTHGDHHIYVSDVKSGKCMHTLEGHPRTPWCIAFHPSSNEILASGCLGGEVRVWDLHGGSEVWVTQQNSVIASLAFHPFDQVLVVATFNELYFWDWNKPKPFACCKTSSEREKVRYVKFDLLGHKLITGIANLPVVQPARSDASRSMATRYASLMEHYNRLIDVRRGQQQQQQQQQQSQHNQQLQQQQPQQQQQQQRVPATQNTGTDPIATNERPTSPTQADALQSAREYAQVVTTDSIRYNRLSEEHLPSTSSTEEFDRNAWRYRDPLRLRETSSTLNPGIVPAVQSNSSNNQIDVRNRDTSLPSSQEGNSLTETSLPSSLIQALVRLQRSLEVLTQTRVNAGSERNNSEQAHLRQRIEEILNRLFNLYASITPLRILMDEVFQDVDRESVLAGESIGSITGQSGLDSQLQELRQQLTRLLERILGSESDRNNLSNASNLSLPSTSSNSWASINQSEVGIPNTPRLIRQSPIPIPWEPTTFFNLNANALPHRNVVAFRRHSNNDQGMDTSNNNNNNNNNYNTNINVNTNNHEGTSETVEVRRPATDSTVHLRLCVVPSVRIQRLQHHNMADGSDAQHSSLNLPHIPNPASSTQTSPWTFPQTRGLGANLSSATSNPQSYTGSPTIGPIRLPRSYMRSISHACPRLPATTTDSNPPLSASLSTETPRTIQIPRVQIDPAEPTLNESEAESRPRMRPRSPPLSSMVNIDQSAGRQVFVDYQAATTSSSVPGSRVPGGSLFLHPNYVASLFEESLQRTNALQLVINRAIAGTFLGTAEFAVVNNVMSLTHRIQWWDFSRLRIPDISDCRSNIVVSECKIHNDASVDISADSSLLAVLVPGTVGLPSTTVVSLYSLEKRNIGTCLYSYYFGPNAISVSLSPLSRYIIVGLASRRVTVAPNEKQVVAQIFKLLAAKENTQGNLDLIRNIEQGGSNRLHVSLNSVRWLPQPGQGIVYGTNRGDLKICRPGPSKEDDFVQTKNNGLPPKNLLFTNMRSAQGHSMQSTSTQTVSPQTQSAGTQTGVDLEVSGVISSTSTAAH